MVRTESETTDSLRLPALLMLTGQLAYIAVTQFHVGGEANDHHQIFMAYAESAIWTGVHLGQFVAMALLLAGLAAMQQAMDMQAGRVSRLGRFGAGAAVAALALYGVLQAVDGVALKQAVDAWATAPEAEKAARFASAEVIRWLEWGARSYQDVAMGIAMLLLAAAAVRTKLPTAIMVLMGVTGMAYLAQGWVAGTDGFTAAQSIAIVAGWISAVVWMAWLAWSRSGSRYDGPQEMTERS